MGGWIEKWLRHKVKHLSQVGVYGGMGAYSGYAAPAQSPNLKRAEDLLQHVNDLFDDNPLQIRLYDITDDPQKLCGRRVVLLDDVGQRRHEVLVVSYDSTSALHSVVVPPSDKKYECNMLT